MSVKNLKNKCVALLSGQVQFCTEIVSLCDPKYKFKSYLGDGGETLNFEIINTKMANRIEVLKIRRPDLSKRAVKKFSRTYEILVSLRNNRCFPIVYDANEEYGFITMEFVEGTSLDKYISRQDISLKEKLAIFLSCCKSVQLLHKNGSYHRDIKPENIMIRISGEACLIDFGLAKSSNTNTLTRTGDILGTTFYISPEQVLDSSTVDYRTDLYSLGRLLYFMLTGDQEFFEAEMVEETDFIGIINYACEINVEERYQNVGEMISDIREVINDQDSEQIPELRRTQRVVMPTANGLQRKKDVVDAFIELFVILGGQLYKVQKYTGLSNKKARHLLSCAKKRILSYQLNRFSED